MLQDTETCTKCGKEKSRRMLGSVTQWLLDVDSCNCERLKIAPEFNQEIELCSTCGLRLPSGRAGSMTQWIFSASICKCQAPHLAGISAGNSPAEQDEASRESSNAGSEIDAGSKKIESEPELELDPTRFPTQRYKAIKVLGKGGSGFVYLCHDRLLNKKVAVKTLRQLTGEQLISFQTEARANSKLNHPAILTLLDFGPTESGSPYMVLEYFESITLADYLEEQGPLSVIDAVHVIGRVTSALATAHEQGIFHRDLKPSNILLSTKLTNEPPEVKLIDFGVAEIQRNTMPTITVEGQSLAGTPSYMAPDSFLGKAYDARSEIYSVGCVLFESLSGVVPFSGESAMEVLNQHAKKVAPRLSEVLKIQRASPVHPDVEALISKCLEKDPASRYSSMQELHDSIIHLPSSPRSGHGQISTGIKKQRKLNEKKLVLVAIPVLLVGAGAYFALSTQTRTSDGTENRGSEITSKGKLPAAKIADKLEERRTAAARGSSPVSEKDQVAGWDETILGHADLEEASARGDRKKQYLLGNRYYDGNGVQKNYERAIYWYRKAAKNGQREAMNDIGWMYQNGQGVSEDTHEALKWYHKAAALNYPLAQANIGYMYAKGIGIRQDLNESVRWYRKAVAQGDAVAQVRLGYAYREGLGVERDDEEAAQLFSLAAQQNNSMGISNLAAMYLQGRGVPTDVSKSLRLYEQACKMNDVYALHDMGEIYEYGEVVPRDYKKAAIHYRAASELGNSSSTNSLGWLYQNGNGVARDYKEAMRLYRLAEEQGNPAATCNIGQLYEFGLGVPRDPKRAVELYRDAAEQGNTRGINSLGCAYRDGIGVKKNYKEAVRLFSQAADLDYDQSIDNLACMYRDGLGVPKDTDKAIGLFQIAIRYGSAHARYHLGECYERGIGVKKDMSSALTWYESAANKDFQPAKDRLKVLRKH